MPNKGEAELFPPKGESRTRVYAYSIQDEAHAGQLKVGQTIRDVKTLVAEQVKTAGITNYTIELDEPAERNDGTTFSDHDLRAHLKRKAFANPTLEWMQCSVADVQTAITELKTGARLTGTHHLTFPMRSEQARAVLATRDYFNSRWNENMNSVPRFLWNAKMRFGKTFTTYQLAKAIGAKKVLVLTFKPAVEDAWQTDLESHADFDGWQYLSKKAGGDPTKANKHKPLVYFGSFQDLLGKDKQTGLYKPKNEWIHQTDWDLVVFDEYHFGAWRENAKELFEGEEPLSMKKEIALEASADLAAFDEELDELGGDEVDFLPIKTRSYLYLSGTPFRALATGEFIEEQIFNWTYTDEQRAKREFAEQHPGKRNPYAALPEMRLMTYQMPDEVVAIASKGQFNEFDLNEFFAATGSGSAARFTHESEVQKWLDILRGTYAATQVDLLKQGASKPPFPYSDTRLLPYLQHSFWFLPTVASCDAMANLLTSAHNLPAWGKYAVLNVSGTKAGIGLDALGPVKTAIGSGRDTATITLSCGKLTTGVTVPQWSAILMLRSLKSPESYFQAAFRVQSSWTISNPEGDDPAREDVQKPVCFVFDFAPDRALSQIAEYGRGLAVGSMEPGANPEDPVAELIEFLPVLAYDGSHMTQLDAGAILDWAMSGTSATLLARKWQSAVLVNVDNETLKRILGDPRAMEAVMNIEGFRKLGDNVLETIVNKSEAVKEAKKKLAEDAAPAEKKALSDEEKEYRSKRKEVQEKLIKFATRIPAFMYLTDYRENTLTDVITKIEPDLFRTVTGLTVDDFNLLVSLGVFNAHHMNEAVFYFRRYEDASLSYTGIESHPGLTRIGGYDTVVGKEH